MWGVTSPTPFPCTVTIVPPNKISEISPHFVCNFCQHVSRTTFCALFSLSLSLSLSLELRTYMVPSIHKPYIYFTIWHRALYRICHTALSRQPCPLCCQFCQYSVEFFETPWMSLAVSPARLFPVFFSLCIFTQLLYRKPVASSIEATIHLWASIPISAHTHTYLAYPCVSISAAFVRFVRVVSLVLSLQLFAFSTIQWRSFVVKDLPQRKLQQQRRRRSRSSRRTGF